MGLEAMLFLGGLLNYHTLTFFVPQAAAAAQVRTYRDNGVKHSNSSYNRVGRINFRYIDGLNFGRIFWSAAHLITVLQGNLSLKSSSDQRDGQWSYKLQSVA